MNIVFDDEYIRQMTELIVSGFVGWMTLQLEAEKMNAAFEHVMRVLGQDQGGQQIALENYQAGYDEASWLSGVASSNGFEEMAAILDAAADRFSHAL